jgi:hypothetical protein
MTFDSSSEQHFVNLNEGNSSKLGTYSYCISSTNLSLYATSCFSYEVTITGKNATTSESIIYFFLGVLSLFLFSLSLFGAIKIPWKHPRNDRGIIVGLNDLKYAKLFLWFFTYLLLIFIAFAFKHISLIANWDVAGNFLNFVFYLLIGFLLPVFILTMIIGFISVMDGKKLDKMIRGGFKVK